MVTQAIRTVPFEEVAIDLIGTFEKGKGGYRFILTYICIASGWPEAIPLKIETARAMADSLVEIFSRNGVPLVMLSDQGAQLTGALMKELCNILGIVKVSTTPYRPQSIHGTLVPMIRKSMSTKMDWVHQVLSMP